jgi:hypothetical protein
MQSDSEGRSVDLTAEGAAAVLLSPAICCSFTAAAPSSTPRWGEGEVEDVELLEDDTVTETDLTDWRNRMEQLNSDVTVHFRIDVITLSCQCHFYSMSCDVYSSWTSCVQRT